MDRRAFLQGSFAIFSSSLVIGQKESKQIPTEPEKTTVGSAITIDKNGDFIFPGFFTVFVDGEEAFRLFVGDSIVAERNCRIVIFKGFENKPDRVIYLFEGDSLTVE